MISFILEAHLLSREVRAVDGLFRDAHTLISGTMPIRIKVKKLEPWNNDLADQIKVDMLNVVVEDFAREAQRQLSEFTCEHHPDKVSYIIIATDRKNTMLIKRRFCCRKFGQRITAKLKGYI